MAITSSAKKAIRVSLRKRVFNTRRADEMRKVIKEIKLLVLSKKGKEAQAMLSKAYQVIDKAAKGQTIKKNNAARKKSRLSQLIKQAK